MRDDKFCDITASEQLHVGICNEVYNHPEFKSKEEALKKLKISIDLLNIALDENDNEAIIEATKMLGGLTGKILIQYANYGQYLDFLFPDHKQGGKE